jgi:hypothetical protein
MSKKEVIEQAEASRDLLAMMLGKRSIDCDYNGQNCYDEVKQDEVFWQFIEASSKVDALVQSELNNSTNSAELSQAVAEIKETNIALQKTINDLHAAVNAIKIAAKVLGLIDKVIALYFKIPFFGPSAGVLESYTPFRIEYRPGFVDASLLLQTAKTKANVWTIAEYCYWASSSITTSELLALQWLNTGTKLSHSYTRISLLPQRSFVLSSPLDILSNPLMRFDKELGVSAARDSRLFDARLLSSAIDYQLMRSYTATQDTALT